MSRIHDALRRGRGPAVKQATKRTAPADAVLAALGYRSGKPSRARAALQVGASLLGVGLLAGWFLMPRSGFLRVFERAGPPAVSTIVPSTPVTVPRQAVVSLTSTSATRDPRMGEPQGPGPLPATKTPAPVVAVSPPARISPAPSTIESRKPTIGKPQNGPRALGLDPRSLVVDLRTQAPKVAAAAPDEFQLALYYQRSGDFEQALMHYRAALQRDEMNVEAHNNVGNLYLGKGLFEEAAREFQRVIAIDPKYVNAHVNLSAAYTRLGRPDAAAAEARAALQIDGRNPDAMVNLSLAQHDAGLTGDAQRSLRRVLEIDPHNAAAHYNMARQFEAAGELASAIAHYTEFIQYATPEQTGFAADVRARVAALTARLK